MDNSSIDETMLAGIWRRHLKLEDIGRDDDFFALGGTSLHAAQICLEIGEATGLDLPITVLLDAPTIAELAAYIRTSGDAGNGSLVLLKPGSGAGLPLFLIHPVGGTVLVYRELAGAMSTPGPVYGIQAAGLVDDREIHGSVEEMAEYYCDCVAAVHPDGPCLLAGYSAGGVIAFAMAQRLLRIGREVRFLGLINTHFLFRRTGRQIGLLSRLPAYVRYARDRGMVQAVADLSRHLRHKRQLRTAEAMLDAKGSTFDGRRRKLIRQILGERPASSGNRYSVIQQVQQIAATFYQPSIYPGAINLYKTADYHENRPGEIGWQRMAVGGVRSKPVPGTHFSLMQGDNAAVLAAILSDDINSIEGRPPLGREDTSGLNRAANLRNVD